jgi:hypothetical protein
LALPLSPRRFKESPMRILIALLLALIPAWSPASAPNPARC